MRCAELMQPEPAACTPEQTLFQALQLMSSHDVGSIPVVDVNKRPVGIVTDRDAALYLAEHDRRPSEVSCSEAMSSPLITCDVQDDLDDAIDKMRDYQLRRIVVLEHGRVAGIIAQADLAREKPGDARKVVEDVSRPKAA